MTDILNMLESLVPDQTDSLLAEAAAIAADEGIDVFGLYCLHTGKRIGSFDYDELALAVRDEATEDSDELASALMIRVVASMRPSPALNKPDHLTIRSMATHRPVDTMAYLVNRLNGTRQLLTKRSDESFSPLIGRITTYKRIADLAAAGVDLTPWIHWLLELDSKMNLHDLTPPMVKIAPIYRLLFDILCLENHEQLLKDFESWTFEQLRKFEKRDAQLTRESNWIRGNVHTRAAYVRSWMENPEIAKRVEIANNKLQAAHDKRVKPGRPMTEKAKLQQTRVAKALDALSAILDGPVETQTSTVAKPKPTLKLNFAAMAKRAQKES